MSFAQALALTISPSVEGGFTIQRNDPGNWTSGVVGKGELLGTMEGISAEYLWSLPASNPCRLMRPQDLTEEQIASIYKVDYWDTVQCDALAPPVAGLIFDASVNQGPGTAARFLQAALGVFVDGRIGPKTLASAKAADVFALHAEVGRVRDNAYRQDAQFMTFGEGWLRRLFTVVAATATFN